MRINPLAPQDHIYLWTTSRRGKWRVCNTLTRVEADITSLLGTQAPTKKKFDEEFDRIFKKKKEKKKS